jgi:hypothetical protein
LQCSPTAEEMALLEASSPAERGDFGPVESWFFRVGAPALQPLPLRLMTLKTLMTYEESVQATSVEVAAKQAAACALMARDSPDAKALHYMLRAAVAAGNFLNFKSKRFGMAAGYQLSSLTKLADTKSPTNHKVGVKASREPLCHMTDTVSNAMHDAS